MRASELLLSMVLTAGMAGAQDFLNCGIVPGWGASGARRDYVAGNLYEYKDGGAEGYLVYGFVGMRGISCASGGNTLDIDISEMSDADAAYGIFIANHDPNTPIARLGTGGQVQRQSATFAKDKYYVEIVEVAANPASDDTATMQAFATGIEKSIGGRSTPPDALEWFPKEGLVSTRLVPESVLGLKQLRRGYVATYKQGQAFIVQEGSPQAAAEVLKSVRERFDGTSPAQVGDEAFQVKVKYLDGICVFRKGRFVGGYANLPDSGEAASRAGKLAARLP